MTCDCTTTEGYKALEKNLVYDPIPDMIKELRNKVENRIPPLKSTVNVTVIPPRTPPRDHLSFDDSISSKEDPKDTSNKRASRNSITGIIPGPSNHTPYTTGRGVYSAGRGNRQGKSGSGGRGGHHHYNKRYDITLGYNPNTAKYSSGGNILQQVLYKIYTKTSHRGIFHP